MKKILILNGAGKKNGNTAALIKAFTEGAESAGNEVKEFYLQNMNIHGCLDCHGCARKQKGDPHPCVQKDDMDQIYEACKEADVIWQICPDGDDLHHGCACGTNGKGLALWFEHSHPH